MPSELCSPSPADLLGRILAAAGLSTPDGHRLVHYPVDDATHAEIVAALEPLLADLSTDDDVRRLVKRPAHRHVPALFCLHAAEAWRKHYDGSHWAWRHIPLASGLAPEARSELVLRGLRSLSRHVLRLERREYLGTIAAESGLPPGLIRRDGTALRAFFRALLADLSRFRDVPPAELASSHADHLPARLTDPDYLELLAEVASTAVALSDALARQALEPPVTPALLAQVDPDWRARFPLRLDDDAAVALVSGLVQDASEAASTGALPRIVTSLEVTATTVRLDRSVDLPARLSEDGLREAFSIPMDVILPTRLDILHETQRGPRLLAELVRRGDAFQVEDRRSPKLGADVIGQRAPELVLANLSELKQISLTPRVLVRGGGQTYGPLDPGAPTLDFLSVTTFERTAGGDGDAGTPAEAPPVGTYRLMGEGSLSISRERDALVLVPSPNPALRIEPSKVALLPARSQGELGLVHLPHDVLGATITVTTGNDAEPETVTIRRSLRASPKFLQLRAPEFRAADRTLIYLSMPRSTLSDDDPRPPTLELLAGDRTWHPADAARFPTNTAARLVRDESVLARFRLRVCPTRHASPPRVTPTGPRSCRISLDLPLDTRVELASPGLRVSNVDRTPSAPLVVDIEASSEPPPPMFEVLLGAPDGDYPPLTLRLRFPRGDAGFALADGTRLPRDARLPLERLSEIVAEAWRPRMRHADPDDTITLRVSIIAQDVDPEVQPVRVAALTPDGSAGLHSCHLVTVERHLRALMAFSTAQDAELRVDLMTPTNPVDTRHPRIYLTRFDGQLRVERDGPTATIRDATGSHLDALDVVSMSPLEPARAVPWQRIEERWAPETPLPQGPSLVIGRDRVTGAVPVRPGLTVQPATSDSPPPVRSELARTISLRQYVDRKSGMRRALSKLPEAPAEIGWHIIEDSIQTLGTFPASTFEVIRNLVAVPRALAYAMMHTAYPERLIDALRELPFAPSAFPVKALTEAAATSLMALHGQLSLAGLLEPMPTALQAIQGRTRAIAHRLAAIAPELGPLLADALSVPELKGPTPSGPEGVLLAFRRRIHAHPQPPALAVVSERFDALVATPGFEAFERPIETSPEALHGVAAAPVVAAALAIADAIPDEGPEKSLLLDLYAARSFDPDYFVEMHVAAAHHLKHPPKEQR